MSFVSITDKKFSVIVLKTSRHGREPAVAKQANYQLPDNISDEIVFYFNFFANFLLIITKRGNYDN